MSTGSITLSITLLVPFALKHEIYNLKQFQKDGHFVPGLTDDEGRRRQWKGTEVHVLELRQGEQQILRVLSDSLPSAQELMAQRIQDEFFRLATQEQRAKFSYDAYMRVNFEHGLMKAALRRHGLDNELRDIEQAAPPQMVG